MASYLFDIGNVILFFDFQLAVQRVAAKCKIPAEEILPSLAPLTEAFERGEMDTVAFTSAATELIGYSDPPEQLIPALEDIFTENQPIISLIEALKAAGHPLYLLSNTNAIHAPYFTHRYSVFKNFAGAIFSHEVGAMKPSPAIYQAAIDKFSLDPLATIYIDDIEENIVAGSKLGLQGIRYQGDAHETFVSELKKLNAGL
jgi:putative hydrolase of the HAD superfamily